MDLGFLNDISLVKTEATRTRSTSIDTTPADGADLRLFSDGRIFPSAKLTADHNLEYVNKGDEVGNGFDIVDTAHFPNYPEGQPRLVMVALTPKDNAKVDVFGSVGYDEAGAPKNSVLSQGSSTTGKWLITLLEEVYGEVFNEARFVDLVISNEFALTTPNNIYQFPKRVTRGENKGEMSYVRRTDTALWPLTVLEVEATLSDDNPPSMEMDIDPVSSTFDESMGRPTIVDENEIFTSNDETL